MCIRDSYLDSFLCRLINSLNHVLLSLFYEQINDDDNHILIDILVQEIVGRIAYHHFGLCIYSLVSRGHSKLQFSLYHLLGPRPESRPEAVASI